MQVLNDYAGQSFRLMALAVGTLRHASPSELASMDQQQAERHCDHMDLLGLVVLSNHLHPASQNTITELQERYASHLTEQYCSYCCSCITCYSSSCSSSCNSRVAVHCHNTESCHTLPVCNA